MDGTENQGTGGPQLTLEDVKKLLTPLTESMRELAEGQKGLAAEVQGVKEAQKNPSKDDDPDKDKKVDPRDLEGLSRKDFMDLIVSTISDKIAENIKPVQQRLDTDQEKAVEKQISDALNASVKSHKDFWEWKKEMGEELVKNPYLMPEDAYTLARTKNPEKAKEMDEKYPSDEATREKEEQEALEKSPGYGGLTPTSGQTEESENLTFEEASKKAWDETAGHLEK